MKEHDHSLAAAAAGDQRRAVGERGPGALRNAGIRLGQHLTIDGDVARHRHAAERTFARESGERLRLFPGQRAAERAAAAAQPHRNEFVVGGCEPRTCEAQQHAAILDPFGEPFARRTGDIADIGKDQHRYILIDEADDRVGRRDAIAHPHIGERAKCALQIEGRGEQRLRGVGGCAGDHADRCCGASACRAIARRRRSVRRRFRGARCRFGFRPED